MVFGNVDDDSLLAEFLPKRGDGAVIVTSRDPDIDVGAKPGRSYRELAMKPMKLSDAISFLRQLAPSATGSD